MLDQYTYVFVIGTFFALLDAYNNGASEYNPTLTHSALQTPGLDTDQSQTMSPTPGLPVFPPDPSRTDKP